MNPMGARQNSTSCAAPARSSTLRSMSTAGVPIGPGRLCSLLHSPDPKRSLGRRARRAQRATTLPMAHPKPRLEWLLRRRPLARWDDWSRSTHAGLRSSHAETRRENLDPPTPLGSGEQPLRQPSRLRWSAFSPGSPPPALHPTSAPTSEMTPSEAMAIARRSLPRSRRRSGRCARRRLMRSMWEPSISRRARDYAGGRTRPCHQARLRGDGSMGPRSDRSPVAATGRPER